VIVLSSLFCDSPIFYSSWTFVLLASSSANFKFAATASGDSRLTQI
jgi:hypothetical protein